MSFIAIAPGFASVPAVEIDNNGRQTDSAGEKYWVGTILNGTASLDSVPASIFGSPEFAARAAATAH